MSFVIVSRLPGKLPRNAETPLFPSNPPPLPPSPTFTTQVRLSICSKWPYFFSVKQQSNHSMLGVHASAWAIIHYGYIARKQGLTGVCLDSLSRLVVAHLMQFNITLNLPLTSFHVCYRIHTIPSVPIVDCFQKIRQQVKCYLQMAGGMGKQELQEVSEIEELQRKKIVIFSTDWRAKLTQRRVCARDQFWPAARNFLQKN